ncbi:hypothetical protein RHMOL_Rhmol04G0347700 [Rhododendron molle]|uniref:Uncharacterized protein n=1 Tax=Rhododendron molle TaxID=49168 RepID=A0ACC0P7Q0_RHOML|nr:hypothetical protein RHMOL_Rhmol04G0347700 [Rhododendron molle]
MMPKGLASLLLLLIVLITRAVRILCGGDEYDQQFFNAYDQHDHGLSIYGDGGQLKMGYYDQSCPSVETVVRNITWSNVAAKPFLAAKLLRLHFHDAFVRGNDASVLLDSTSTNKAEKDAFPNLSLSGYDVIDEIKAALEEKCNGTVSCADILAMAARDAVSFQFQRPMWEVLTGRKDGKISLATDIGPNIPSPRANFSTLLAQFSSKGLNIVDLVVLSGGHTIGIGHCSLIFNRLYNFTGKGDTDPFLNQDYAKTLMGLCPKNSPASSVEMDPHSSLSFDSHYFTILNQKKGLFLSDAALLTDRRSALISQLMRIPRVFYDRFARSMMKMGAIGVLGDGNALIRECEANGLRKNFYEKSCPQAEQLGCDASVLLDTVGTTKSEKDTIPNLTLSGFDVIDDVKAKVEQVCPGIVSCADILALAARDSVSFPFKQPKWDVLTGRRDGRISLASDVAGNIPSPFSDFITLKKVFAKKGLSATDLVVLSGGHTIGVAHCATFSNRLYNFTGEGDSDPSLNPTYAQSLKKQCPNPAKSSTTAEMDPRSSLTFDTHYFTILNQHKGLFQSDAALLTDKKSAEMVKQLQSTDDFFFEFNKSMEKIGAVELLTGKDGEIRKKCRVVN